MPPRKAFAIHGYGCRAVAALAADPAVLAKTGRTLSSWGLAPEYGIVDTDGRRPDWGAFFTVWERAVAELRRLHGISEREACARLARGQRPAYLTTAMESAQAPRSPGRPGASC